MSNVEGDNRVLKAVEVTNQPYTVGAPGGGSVSSSGGNAETDPKHLEKITEEVKTRVAKIEAQARQKGWEAGRAEFEKKFNGVREAWIKEAHTAVVKWTAALEEPLMDLVCLAAERLARQHFEINREALRPLIQEGLQALTGETQMAVHVPSLPDDVMEKLRTAVMAQIKEAAVTVESDPSLQPGDVVVSSPSGRWESTWKDRVERVRESLNASPAAA